MMSDATDEPVGSTLPATSRRSPQWGMGTRAAGVGDDNLPAAQGNRREARKQRHRHDVDFEHAIDKIQISGYGHADCR
jgi:hypothetical protein